MRSNPTFRAFLGALSLVCEVVALSADRRGCLELPRMARLRNTALDGLNEVILLFPQPPENSTINVARFIYA